METKVTVYLSIIITAFFASSMIPLTMFISQPLSVVLLAYFRPVLNKKIIVGALLALFFGNVILEMAWFLNLVNTFASIFTFIGLPNMLALTVTVLTIFVASTYLSFISADGIISKTNLRKRTLQF